MDLCHLIDIWKELVCVYSLFQKNCPQFFLSSESHYGMKKSSNFEKFLKFPTLFWWIQNPTNGHFFFKFFAAKRTFRRRKFVKSIIFFLKLSFESNFISWNYFFINYFTRFWFSFYIFCNFMVFIFFFSQCWTGKAVPKKLRF